MIEKILIYIPKIIEHTYIAKAFYNVLYMSILAIIVGLVIYLIQEILDKKITPKWKITLWLVLLIALIVPINNSSKYQNNNWLLKTLQPIQNISFKKEVQDKEALYNSYIQKEDTNYQDYKKVRSAKYNAYIKYTIFDIMLPVLWGIGIVYIIFKNIIIKIIIAVTSKKNKTVNERYNTILEECKNKLKIKRKIRLINQKNKKTPAIYGIVNPKILINEEFLEKYSDEEISYMFMHELSHYKGFDLYLNFLLKIINTIHWFNPFCYIFFKRIRQDIELKADSIAIKSLKAEDNKNYALTIIKVLANRNYKSYETEVLNLIGIQDDNQRRIYMIKFAPKFKEKVIRLSFLSISLISSLLIIFFIGKYTKIENDPFDFNYEDMVPYKVEYIGDFNKVKTLVKKLSLGRYVKYMEIPRTEDTKGRNIKIEYFTYGNKETEPVFYEFLELPTERKEEILKKNAITILSLVENSNSVKFIIKESPNYDAKTNIEKEFTREEQKGIDKKGGTMRLGAYPCIIKEGTLAQKVYGKTEISERHRHRFEYNNDYKERLEKAGLICSGTSPDGKLVEIVELSQKEHPYFIAGQFHPELKSRPNKPAPLFVGLVKATKERK